MINCLLTLCVDTLVSYCSSFKDVFLHVLYAGLGNTTDMLQMSKAPVVFARFILMLKKNMLQYILMFLFHNMLWKDSLCGFVSVHKHSGF